MSARFSKDFILVVIGQVVSIFGNQIVRFALPLYLLNKTGSPALFGTILAISFIPMILLFPVGGINFYFMTCLQILTPKDLIGKIVSVVMCVCYCTSPLGQFIYGIVFEYIKSNTYVPFYVASFVMIGISVFTRRIFYGTDDLINIKYHV